MTKGTVTNRVPTCVRLERTPKNVFLPIDAARLSPVRGIPLACVFTVLEEVITGEGQTAPLWSRLRGVRVLVPSLRSVAQFTVATTAVGATGPDTVEPTANAPAVHKPVSGRIIGARVFPLLVSTLRLKRLPVASASRFVAMPTAGELAFGDPSGFNCGLLF